MKFSQFAVPIQLDSGITALFSTLTGRFVLLTEDVARTLGPYISGSHLPRFLEFLPCCQELKGKGILVPDAAQEIEEYRQHSHQTRVCSTAMRLLLLPTRVCNLRCWYCYQGRTKRASHIMSMETASRVVRFVERQFDSGVGMITVGFYGGEPLTNVSVCDYLAEEISARADRHAVRQQLVLTTNGFLLAELRRHSVVRLAHGIHLTIDGAPEHHDRVRINGAGQGSYQRILAGIRSVRECGKHMRIRVHIRGLEEAGWVQILNDLEAAGLTPQASSIYLVDVDEPAACNPTECAPSVMSTSQIERQSALFSVLRRASENHPLGDAVCWNRSTLAENQRTRYVSCVYERDDTYVVDYGGSLVQCPISLDRDVIGVIGDDGTASLTGLTGRASVPRYENSVCLRCAFLPKCGGNCLVRPAPKSDQDCSARRDFIEHQMRSSVLETIARCA